MGRMSKRLKAAYAQVDRDNRYGLDEAVELVAKLATCKFDETVELAVRLGVDPRQADQNVRGTVSMPHGTGRSVRVLVFAKGEKEREAQDAGADFVGGEELVKKIADEGWLEFDKAVATPDMMGMVGRIGKVLGPRGLMPNPEGGHGNLRCCYRCRRIEGRQGRVPCGQSRHRSCTHRQSFVRRSALARQCHDCTEQLDSREALVGQRELHRFGRCEHHHGPGGEDQPAGGASAGCIRRAA